MEWKFKKNEKWNKVILVVLCGILLLVIAMPQKAAGTATGGSAASEDTTISYEERLRTLLADTYGADMVDVKGFIASVAEGEGGLNGFAGGHLAEIECLRSDDQFWGGRERLEHGQEGKQSEASCAQGGHGAACRCLSWVRRRWKSAMAG